MNREKLHQVAETADGGIGAYLDADNDFPTNPEATIVIDGRFTAADLRALYDAVFGAQDLEPG